MFKTAWQMKFALNLWPPFLFSNIRIKHLSRDFRQAEVAMTLRFWNQNAMGVHFGGTLFSMTDPFYMLMVSALMGKDYIVWDKTADIDYIKPGKGKVTAHFNVTDTMLDDIRLNTQDGQKYLPIFEVNIIDEQGDIVARLNRQLYVRKKRKS